MGRCPSAAAVACLAALAAIYRGTFPLIAVDVVRLLLLCSFPALALWLLGP